MRVLHKIVQAEPKLLQNLALVRENLGLVLCIPLWNEKRARLVRVHKRVCKNWSVIILCCCDFIRNCYCESYRTTQFELLEWLLSSLVVHSVKHQQKFPVSN